MKNRIIRTLLYIIGLLMLIQFFLFALKQLFFLLVEKTNFSVHIASMIGMIILSIVFVSFVKRQKLSLSVVPERFSKSYIIGTCISAALFVATPSNYSGGFRTISLLIYSSVIVPIFEELIFRGYVWNKLNSIFAKEWITFIVSAVLFGLWHLGYIDSIAFRIETGLATAMLGKIITGFCYGIVLGAVRLKAKNSYSTMLLHGVMNIFGR